MRIIIAVILLPMLLLGADRWHTTKNKTIIKVSGEIKECLDNQAVSHWDCPIAHWKSGKKEWVTFVCENWCGLATQTHSKKDFLLLIEYD